MDLNKYIRDVQDFPKKGITFKDITPLLENSKSFKYAIDSIAANIGDVDKIVWLDARGFLFAGALAYNLDKPLVIIRKSWKLPHKTITQKYCLEYWENSFDIHKDSISSWDKVVIVDDLLATWWTAKAAANLIEKLWGIITSFEFIVNLKNLWWENKLDWYKINSLLEY